MIKPPKRPSSSRSSTRLEVDPRQKGKASSNHRESSGGGIFGKMVGSWKGKPSSDSISKRSSRGGAASRDGARGFHKDSAFDDSVIEPDGFWMDLVGVEPPPPIADDEDGHVTQRHTQMAQEIRDLQERQSNVDVDHLGIKLIDRSDFSFLHNMSGNKTRTGTDTPPSKITGGEEEERQRATMCPHVPGFERIYESYSGVMPRTQDDIIVDVEEGEYI
eukprot:Lankesteria_metandrocarpae@DN9634_c0_g1_i1.p1